RRMSGRLGCLLEGLYDLLQGVLGILDGGDDAVGLFARQGGGLGASRREVDRQMPLDGRGGELGSVGSVVLAVVGQLPAVEEPPHDLERLGHAGVALLVGRELVAEGTFVYVLAGPHSQSEASVRQPIESRSRLGDDA